jgi:hypothetical protein
MKWYSATVFAIGIAFCAALALYPKPAPAQHATYHGTGIVSDEPGASRSLRQIDGG